MGAAPVLTDEQRAWIKRLCSPGTAAPATEISGAPPPGLVLAPDDAAKVLKFLRDHDFKPVSLQLVPKPADFLPWLDGKSTTLDQAAKAAATAAGLASPDLARPVVASEYKRLVDAAVARAAKAPEAPVAPEAKKPEEDGPEVSVEMDPKGKSLETQVQYTIKLRATNDAKPPAVQVLPDAEITIHLGPDGKTPSIEAQLNLIKANVNTLLHLPGKVQIEATVGVSTTMDVRDAAAGKIAKSLEVKIKAELTFKITKNLYFKVGVEEGPDGKPQGGPAVGVTF